MLALSLLAAAPAAEAGLLRVLHTNDLHSHFETYARVKAELDRLEAASLAEGVEVLKLDAGDFLEGSPYYFPGGGRESLRVMNAMGYDASVIGNHDWLMGLDALDALIEAVPPKFAFLGANFIYSARHKALGRHLKKSVELRRGGAKVAILGLTTSEVFYDWRVEGGFVSSWAYEAAQELGALRRRNDVVIALTHLGQPTDRKLVLQTSGLDLVVGGHSHDLIRERLELRDAGGRMVPIVQAGKHGSHIGDVLIDTGGDGRPARVISTAVHPVKGAGESDPHVHELVEEAQGEFRKLYGADWLAEVVGHSEIPMVVPSKLAHTTVWSTFFAEALRESAEAEIGVSPGELFGFDQPAGPVTRERILGFYPRMFETDRPMGWTVWTARIPGWVLKKLVGSLGTLDAPTQFVGLTWKESEDGAQSDFRVNGEPLKGSRSYLCAVPEGLGRGSIGAFPVAKAVFKDVRSTGVPIWTAIEDRLRRVGTVRKPQAQWR